MRKNKKSYFIRYWKKEKGTLEDGILKVPDDISDEEAKKIIEKGEGVKWYVSPEIEKKYQELDKLKNESINNKEIKEEKKEKQLLNNLKD